MSWKSKNWITDRQKNVRVLEDKTEFQLMILKFVISSTTNVLSEQFSFVTWLNLCNSLTRLFIVYTYFSRCLTEDISRERGKAQRDSWFIFKNIVRSMLFIELRPNLKLFVV